MFTDIHISYYVFSYTSFPSNFQHTCTCMYMRYIYCHHVYMHMHLYHYSTFHEGTINMCSAKQLACPFYAKLMAVSKFIPEKNLYSTLMYMFCMY